MKKKANIGFTVLIALIIVCCGAAVLSIAGNSKYNAKTEYQRIEDRYIAESGVDLSVSLFLNYLSNKDLVLAYTKNEDGGYGVIDDYSPYLLEEIRTSEEKDIVPINIIENESKDYLAGVGFLDYINNGTIEFGVNTFGDKESFKLSRMCTEYDFLLSLSGDDAEKRSMLKPVFLTVKTKYRGGEVMANIKISNLYAVRVPFDETEDDIASVKAYIDTSNAIIEYENYQNYRGNS